MQIPLPLPLPYEDFETLKISRVVPVSVGILENPQKLGVNLSLDLSGSVPPVTLSS